jgi:hypothetical protein
MDSDEPSFYDDSRNTPSPLSQDQVIHTAEPWRGSGEGFPAQVEVVSEVVSVPEASRWRWTMAKIIDVPEALVFDDMAWWTRVASSFVGHENICKSQRTVMTP